MRCTGRQASVIINEKIYIYYFHRKSNRGLSIKRAICIDAKPIETVKRLRVFSRYWTKQGHCGATPQTQFELTSIHTHTPENHILTQSLCSFSWYTYGFADVFFFVSLFFLIWLYMYWSNPLTFQFRMHRFCHSANDRPTHWAKAIQSHYAPTALLSMCFVMK